MRNTSFCPLMFWLLGIGIECAYPDLSACGYTMLPYKGTQYQFGICKHMVKEVGVAALKQIVLLKLKELMEVQSETHDG